MELYPLILVTLSAILHLGWNTIVKKADDKFITLMLVVYMIAIAGSLIVAITTDLSSIPAAAWFFMILSGAIHSFYYWFLTKAYDESDLSLVYPYTRGFGALLAVIGGILILGETPSLIGGLGVATIIATILLEPISRQTQLNKSALFSIAVTAIAIGSYLVVDTLGVRTISPWIYLVGMKASSAIFMAPIIMHRPALQTVIKQSFKPALAGAGFLFISYGLTLSAMEIAPIAYVASARAFGIIVSGLVGFFILKEHLTKAHITSIILISIGILLIGLG